MDEKEIKIISPIFIRFYLKDKILCSLLVPVMSGEIKFTKELLAYEHNISTDEINIKRHDGSAPNAVNFILEDSLTG